MVLFLLYCIDEPVESLLYALALDGAAAPYTPITAFLTTGQPQLLAYLLRLKRASYILLVAEYQ